MANTNKKSGEAYWLKIKIEKERTVVVDLVALWALHIVVKCGELSVQLMLLCQLHLNPCFKTKFC